MHRGHVAAVGFHLLPPARSLRSLPKQHLHAGSFGEAHDEYFDQLADNAFEQVWAARLAPGGALDRGAPIYVAQEEEEEEEEEEEDNHDASDEAKLVGFGTATWPAQVDEAAAGLIPDRCGEILQLYVQREFTGRQAGQRLVLPWRNICYVAAPRRLWPGSRA